MIDSKSFSIRLEQHLIKIYGEVKTTKEIKQLSNDLLEFVESKIKKNPYKIVNSVEKWSENDVILISYPDSIVEEKRRPLNTLKKFLDKPNLNPLTPNWNRVQNTMPDFKEKFIKAVTEDSKI